MRRGWGSVCQRGVSVVLPPRPSHPFPSLIPLPTVQHECIPQAILGMDVLCQAKSGMGKTAVFVLSVLQQLEPVDGEVGAVVICHTRELAYQVRGSVVWRVCGGEKGRIGGAERAAPFGPPSRFPKEKKKTARPHPRLPSFPAPRSATSLSGSRSTCPACAWPTFSAACRSSSTRSCSRPTRRTSSSARPAASSR